MVLRRMHPERGAPRRQRFDLDGGARRNRTDDLFNALEALSQLSYGPIFHVAPAAPIGAERGKSARAAV